MRANLIVATLLAVGTCSASSDAAQLNADAVFENHDVIELAEAACLGRTSEVESMIGAGVDPNFVGKDGFTPLLFALQCENMPGLRALINNGADVNQVSLQRYTPAILATLLSDASFLEALIESGADLYRIPQKSTYNAIGSAFNAGVFRQNWGPYDLLIRKDIDLNRTIDKYGRNDLATLATSMNEYDRVLDLLERGYNRDLKGVFDLLVSAPPPGDPGQAAARLAVLEKLIELRR